MINILGLDPGLASTGWGIVSAEGNKVRHLAHGSIKTAAADDMGRRLNIIFKKVQEIISEFGPEYAGIEALYFAKNRKSAIPVAQARGVLLLTCSMAGISAYEFPPPEIKMALTGNGRAEKVQVQEMVKLVLGMTQRAEPDHAADALAVAITVWHNIQVIRNR